MPVISVEPALEFCGALVGVDVGVSVGPLAQRGLDEAFGFAVGLRGVGPGAQMTQAEFVARFAEGGRLVATAVVGHHALHADPEARVAGDGGFEEGDGTFLFLVGPDLRVGDPRVIVDAHVHAFPAGAPGVVARDRP